MPPADNTRPTAAGHLRRVVSTSAAAKGIGKARIAYRASPSMPSNNDGSLICIWADPAADTTHLTTKISVMSRGPALDLLNGLSADHDFTCYTPEGGTRCEGTWQNKDYPVTDGRTVFWRDDILIDTTFSNLAPSGYTSAIVASVFG